MNLDLDKMVYVENYRVEIQYRLRVCDEKLSGTIEVKLPCYRSRNNYVTVLVYVFTDYALRQVDREAHDRIEELDCKVCDAAEKRGLPVTGVIRCAKCGFKIELPRYWNENNYRPTFWAPVLDLVAHHVYRHFIGVRRGEEELIEVKISDSDYIGGIVDVRVTDKHVFLVFGDEPAFLIMRISRRVLERRPSALKKTLFTMEKWGVLTELLDSYERYGIEHCITYIDGIVITDVDFSDCPHCGRPLWEYVERGGKVERINYYDVLGDRLRCRHCGRDVTLADLVKRADMRLKPYVDKLFQEILEAVTKAGVKIS